MTEDRPERCKAWRIVKRVLQRIGLAFGTALPVGGVASGLKFGQAAASCAFGAAILVLFAPDWPRRQPKPAAS